MDMTTLDTVRRLVGLRYKITRDEMAAILSALAAGGLDLRNGYVRDTDDPATAPYTWARACRSITCISVDARRTLRDDNCVRYDEPGSMHPMHRAEILFAPETLARYEYDQIGQLRRHAVRVLVVRDTPLTYDLERGRAAEQALAAQGAARWATVRHAVRADGTWVRVLDDGTLEMRDPNDGHSPDPRDKVRYQYRYDVERGEFLRRMLPPESVGDAWTDIGVPAWEWHDPPEFGPVWDYFEAVAL